jgi:ferredoxin
MLEQSTKAVRAAVLQRSVAQAAGAEPLRCAVCMETPKQLAFNCGHQTCAACGDKMASCPFCRLPITAKIRLYE